MQIHDEFPRADVFVLPTLADGSATVTYEALNAGVHVVTTNGAGSVARDGIDVLIVPESDPGALADAIESIVEHRERHTKNSTAPCEHTKDYTWDR